MKAWGFILVTVAACAACSTPQNVVPVSSPIQPFVGPPLTAPLDFDRADATQKRALHEATPNLSCRATAQCTMLLAAF